MQLFQTGPRRYQAARPFSEAYAQINQRNLAFVVGLIALCLPSFLWIGVVLGQTCFRDSISHFYHAPFWGGPFIGALIFIGAYLCVYQGEDARRAEARLASVAGVAAFGVALFPVAGHGCDAPPFAARALVDMAVPPGAHQLALIPRVPVTASFELFAWVDILHYGSAIVLFGFLAWFALFVFTAAGPDQREPGGQLTRTKQIRNAIYILSGWLILAAMLSLGVVFALENWSSANLDWWAAGNWTFWMEAVSLWAFGISWMVKGRFFGLALED